MNTKLVSAAILSMACTVSTGAGEASAVKSVLDKYQSARPQAADLAL